LAAAQRMELRVVKLPKAVGAKHGFVLLSDRWVVE
jgi:hypothetical protein